MAAPHPGLSGAAGPCDSSHDANLMKGQPMPRPTPDMATSELEPPLIRPLKAYAFDPSQGRLLGNEVLDSGALPGTRRRRSGARRVRLERHRRVPDTTTAPTRPTTYWSTSTIPASCIRGGLDPVVSNSRFHQQMVYAIVTDTVAHFEAALGRRIHWRRAGSDDPTSSTSFRTRWFRPMLFTFRRRMASCSAIFGPTPTTRDATCRGNRSHLPLARHRRARDHTRHHRRNPRALYRELESRRAGVCMGRLPIWLRCFGTQATHEVLPDDPAHRRRAVPLPAAA